MFVVIWFCWAEAESWGLSEVFKEAANNRLCIVHIGRRGAMEGQHLG